MGGPLAADPDDAAKRFILYRGATAEAPIREMFSFVPSLPYESEQCAFARPVIKLDGVVEPNLAMSSRRTPVTLAAACSLWWKVVGQVLDAGLVLGTHLAMPRRLSTTVREGTTNRTSC